MIQGATPDPLAQDPGEAYPRPLVLLPQDPRGPERGDQPGTSCPPRVAAPEGHLPAPCRDPGPA